MIFGSLTHRPPPSSLTKSPSSIQGRRVDSVVPPWLRSACERHSGRAVTGLPGADYWDSPAQSALEGGRRVRPCWCSGGTLAGFHLALPPRCPDGLLLLLDFGYWVVCGPSEIRTRDLLNAIETRSQLRYGPIHFIIASGPEGIRTPDLLSAIEARSQLRYRPMKQACVILPWGVGNVKTRGFITEILEEEYIDPLPREQ